MNLDEILDIERQINIIQRNNMVQTRLNLDGLSERELLNLKQLTESEILDIERQINAAKNRADEGELADRDWWRRVNSALSIKKRQVRQIQSELESKFRRAHSFERRFVELAERELPVETFRRLCRLADGYEYEKS